jgi:hypothetical protein
MITYTANKGYTGPEEFTYITRDKPEASSNKAIVHFDVQ